MGSPYQSQSASGYNSSPPPDDGSVSASNKVTWAKIKTQIGDAVKGLADAINTALRTALNVTPTSQSSVYTTTAADHLRPIEVTGTTTISLGDAATMVAQSMGYQVPIVNRGVATVTVSRITGADTLNGAAKDIKLAPGQAVVCHVNSTNNGYDVIAGSNGVLFDPTDPSKQGRFDVSLVTAGQQRAASFPDFDFKLGNGFVIAAGRNTAARTNASTPNTKLDISADELCLRDANGTAMLVSSVSGTIDFGTTGANGIDTGAQAASTWYYGWVIAKADGTKALLGSTSASAPTMPTGYTFKALVTAARSDGSTHFVPYRQFGNRVYYEAQQSALSNGTATSETAVSLTALVPPSATEILLNTQQDALCDGSGNFNDVVGIRVVSGSTYWSQQNVHSAESPNAAIFCGTSQLTVPNISQQVYYLHTTSAGATFHFSIWVCGYTLPGGGE